jgi:hypothetical protein
MTKEEILKNFFDSVLAGESKTYNDHNWYICRGSVSQCLRGYIEGKSQYPYGLLKKPLSAYTVAEVKEFQAKERTGFGQLWATGRYQIIPDTLKGIQRSAGVSDNDKYDKTTQDKLGWQLILNRKPIKDYLSGAVPDTLENLQKASLEMAKIWSSIGIPYALSGKQKDQSYYHGGGDVASVKSEVVQKKLKELRSQISDLLKRGVEIIKKKPLLTIGLTIIVSVSLYVLYNQLIRKK